MKNNKSLGQNWLKDRIILDGIADLATIKDGSLEAQPQVVEIGPGLGTLTSALLRRFPSVTAIEFDANLAKNLPKSFPGKNLTVVNEDILKYDFSKISGDYVVAGNIPYYITSPIITKLIYLTNAPQKITLLMQKEVAKRIVAEAGDHTVLSLMVQNRADVEYGFDVDRTYFTPPPKVDSAVITLIPKKPIVDEKVIDFIKIGFKSPRKKLSKNLPYSVDEIKNAYKQLNINENVRPAELELLDWKKLLEKLS